MSSFANDSSCPVIDCNSLDPVDVQPYPDISGNGVLLGFLGTAYFVLLLVIASYVLAFDPDEEPFRTQVSLTGPTSNPSWQPNIIDHQFITWVQRLLRMTPDTRVRLRSAFDESIIMLCDIQIVTGFGILCSAYALLRCGFDASHWQIAVYLAWFSAVTHLSGLTVLRTHLNAYPWAKYTRAMLMFALLVLVIVGLIPTGYFFPRTIHLASQVICYFDLSYGNRHFSEIDRRPSESSRVTETSSWQAMLFSILLLVFGFTTRSVRLFRPLSTAFRLRIRQPLSGWTRRRIRRLEPSGITSDRSKTLRSSAITKPALAFFLMVRLSCDLFSSMFVEIYWLLIILLWGTAKLFGARNALIKLGDDIAAAENQWTFGQILPVFLLWGPLFSITGIFAYRVGDKSLPKIFNYSDRAQNAPSGSTLPLWDQTSSPAQANESRPTPDLLLDDRQWQNIPSRTSLTPPLGTSGFRGGDLQHLDDYSDAPWLPICTITSFLSILPPTIIAFVAAFNFNMSLEPQFALYEVWVSVFGLVYFFLISFPCACATNIRIGMDMDLGSRWKKFTFFCICFLIFGAHLVLLLLPIVFFTHGSDSILLKILPFTGLIITILLYTIDTTFLLSTLEVDEVDLGT